MAKDSDLSNSLKISKDLLKTNRQINNSFRERSKLQKDQVDIASEIKGVLDDLAPEQVINALGDIQGALKEIGIDAPGIFSTLKNSFMAIGQVVKDFVNVVTDVAATIAAPFIGFANAVMSVGATITNVGFKIGKAIATIAFFPLVVIGKLLKQIVDFFVQLAYKLLKPVIDGFKKFTKFALRAFRTLLPVVGQFASTLFNIGKALYSLPGIITTNLLNMADSLFAKMLPIIRAFEALKTTLGDPARGLNRQTQDLVKNMGGLDFFGGRGARNLYTYFNDAGAAATAMGEIFGGLGSLAEIQGQQIVDMGIDFVEYYKGMGLTVEQLKAINIEAIASGKSLREVLHEHANMAFQMADAFGFTRKTFAQDMAKMIGDVKRFGTTSIRELGEATAYVKSLGLEVETLGKLVDKYLNFESAIESTASLAQAFGMNLDTMKLMKAASKGGAGALEELRRGFFSAGRDADRLNLAELQLLASRTGMSEAEAKLAFSMRNRGKSMEQIRKEAGKSEKQQRSQVEVLEELSDGIAKIVRHFEHSGSLFNRFTQGFGQGILMNSKFFKSLMGMRSVSETVYQAGRKIGNLFVEMFPGVKKFFVYLDKVFDPKKYQEVMNKITGHFKTFFTALKDPAKAKDAFGELIKNLMDAFRELPGYFQNEGGEAAKEFLGAIRDTIVGALAWLPGVITDVLNTAVAILSGKTLPTGSGVLSQIFGKSADMAGKILNPILKALYAAITNKQMVDAFKALGKRIAELTYDYVLAPLGNMILAGIKSLMLEVFVNAPLRTGLALLQSTLRIFGNYLLNYLDSLKEVLVAPFRALYKLVTLDFNGFLDEIINTLYAVFNIGTAGFFGWLSALWKEWIGNWAGDMTLNFADKVLGGLVKILPSKLTKGTGIQDAFLDVLKKKEMLAAEQATTSPPAATPTAPTAPTAPQTAIPAAPSTGIFGQTPVSFGKQQQQQNVNLVASIDKLNENTDRLATILDNGVNQNLTAMGEVMAREKMFVARSYG